MRSFFVRHKDLFWAYAVTASFFYLFAIVPHLLFH